jgi:hypothetical protein
MRRLGRAAGSLLACALALSIASACNEADVIARPEVVSGNARDAAVALDCNLEAQLLRHDLPSGIGNLFLPDCEWPITQADSMNDLRWLVGDIGSRDDTKAHLCSLDPYRVWQEPPPPFAPQKLVFCEGACDYIRDWLACRLRDDPCRAGAEEVDSGVNYCP